MADRGKRSGAYFFMGTHLIKRRDVVGEVADQRFIDRDWERWFRQHCERLAGREEERRRTAIIEAADSAADDDGGAIELDLDAAEVRPVAEGDCNLCHVKGCAALIADSEFSLFCTEHTRAAMLSDWDDWFPPPGYEPQPRKARRRKPRSKAAPAAGLFRLFRRGF